jgi:hypothetical protein
MNTNQIATTQPLYIPGTILIVVRVSEYHLFRFAAFPALFPLLNGLMAMLYTFIKKYPFSTSIFLNVAGSKRYRKRLATIHVGNHICQ